jgi:hypothetical protein
VCASQKIQRVALRAFLTPVRVGATLAKILVVQSKPFRCGADEQQREGFASVAQESFEVCVSALRRRDVEGTRCFVKP